MLVRNQKIEKEEDRSHIHLKSSRMERVRSVDGKNLNS